MGKIIIGMEKIRCPRCRAANELEIHSDLPEKDYCKCCACGYRAIINFAPILEKYGILRGMSRPESRETARFLRAEINKI